MSEDVNFEIELFRIFEDMEVYKTKVKEAKDVYSIVSEYILSDPRIAKYLILSSFRLDQQLPVKRRVNFVIGLDFSSRIDSTGVIIEDEIEEIAIRFGMFEQYSKRLGIPDELRTHDMRMGITMGVKMAYVAQNGKTK